MSASLNCCPPVELVNEADRCERAGLLATAWSYARSLEGDRYDLSLGVSNLHCPSCIDQIERGLADLPGLEQARVNLSTRRLFLRWREESSSLDEIISRVTEMGYRLAPMDSESRLQAGEREERELLRAVALAGFAAANVMLLSVSVWSGLVSDMGPATRALMHWVSALIALPTVVIAGRPFFRSALAALRGGRLNMDVPISLAVTLAAGMSLSETMRGGEHVYFDAAVTLLFFLLIGRYLDLRIRGKARSAAENLMAMRAASATVIDPDGRQRRLAAAQVEPGMMVAVAAGERIPVDGTVVQGRSDVDTALVTGESLPRTVAEGTSVFAGTLNLNAALRIRVTSTEDTTLLAEIVNLMEAAEQGRARYQRLADRVARAYAPVVHILSAATFLGWLWVGSLDWQLALLTAVAVLIITCPCALGLAVPAVQVAAVDRLLRRGILVKAADGLERLAQADVAVFDKTGTLTLGRPEPINIKDIAPNRLQLAAGLAAASKHPLARALYRAAEAQGPVPALTRSVIETPGMGLSTEVNGCEVRLGNRSWCGVGEQAAEGAAGNDLAMELWLSGGAEPPVCFQFRDALRPDALHTITALKKHGLGIELLSGDRSGPVEQVACSLGIETWHAECRPDAKIARLKELSAQGKRVLMVGDGLNDAPALAEAFVSVSPADASEVSQTAADLIFQGESLDALVEAQQVAVSARGLVLQNFALAFLYNAIAVPFAMAGMVTPLVAAVAMSASSIVVTVNSLRLYAMKRRLMTDGTDAKLSGL
ncbi:heavy metal translocating P-type ATPase [Pelagibius sp. Alg239-R121]|uniref:heavy metal translocating P-type ATPase n=1 Tax=Pelagibius sp. Alg239-R121 TaxID=2993448 RepID=UPI0024A75985|nr:heavy metal translocating P-type ATPase [Pelagibius sp. Alg239-R121]